MNRHEGGGGWMGVVWLGDGDGYGIDLMEAMIDIVCLAS